MDGGPSLPFPLGDRTHRPLVRWTALDETRVAFGAATDTEAALRAYAAGLQVGYLLRAAYYGLLTAGYLLWALLTMGYLLWAVNQCLPALLTYYGYRWPSSTVTPCASSSRPPPRLPAPRSRQICHRCRCSIAWGRRRRVIVE